MATTESQGVASQALEQVQERTEDARAQVQEKARAQLDSRSTQLGEQVGSVAQALRTTSQQLEGDGNTAGANAPVRSRATPTGSAATSATPTPTVSSGTSSVSRAGARG